MKRHVQFEGVRKWAGDHLLELQSEPLAVLDRFFGQYGPYVLQDCEVSPAGDLYDVAPGLVVITGKDRNGEDATMVVPFAGAAGIQLPLYLTLAFDVRQFEYASGGVKPIAYDYYVESSTVEPVVGMSYLLLNEQTPRFTDAIQDDRHRFLTAQQVEDLAKSPKYRGLIEDGDANALLAYGVYSLALGEGYVNFPADGIVGVLTVGVAGNNINQTIASHSDNAVWSRSYNGATWTEWSKMFSTDDIEGVEYEYVDVSGWTDPLSASGNSWTSAGTASLTKDFNPNILYRVDIELSGSSDTRFNKYVCILPIALGRISSTNFAGGAVSCGIKPVGGKTIEYVVTSSSYGIEKIYECWPKLKLKQ